MIFLNTMDDQERFIELEATYKLDKDGNEMNSQHDSHTSSYVQAREQRRQLAIIKGFDSKMGLEDFRKMKYLDCFRTQARTLGSGTTTQGQPNEEGEYFTKQSEILTSRADQVQEAYNSLKRTLVDGKVITNILQSNCPKDLLIKFLKLVNNRLETELQSAI